MLRMQPVIDAILKKHQQALQNEAQVEFKNQFNLNLINFKNQLHQILNDYLKQRKNYVFLQVKRKLYGVPQQDKSKNNSKSYQDYFSNKSSDTYSMHFYEKLSTILSSIISYESGSSSVIAIDELLTEEAKHRSPTLYKTASQIKNMLNQALYFSIDPFDAKKFSRINKTKQSQKYEAIKLDIENFVKNKINEQYEVKLRAVENLPGYLNLLGQLQEAKNSFNHFEKSINDFKYHTREDAFYDLAEKTQNPWSRGPTISQSAVDGEYQRLHNADGVAYANLNTSRAFAKAEVNTIRRDIVTFEAQFKISSGLMKLCRLISSKNTIEEKLNALVGDGEYGNFIQTLQSQLVGRGFAVNKLNLFKPEGVVDMGYKQLDYRKRC